MDLFSDPNHLIILMAAVSIVAMSLWNNRGLRRAFNTLADAAAKQPAPAQAEDIGNALAIRIVELQKPLQEEIIRQNADLKRQNTDLTTDRDALKGRLLDLEKTVNLQTAAQANLQTQLDAQCALIQDQNQKLEALQKSLTSKDTEIEAKNRIIAELTTKVQQIENLEQRVKKLEEEVKALTMDKQQLEQELNAAKSDLQAEKARADRLAADLQRTEQKLALAEAELSRVKATLPENQISARADIPPGYVAAPLPDVPEVPPARDGAA